MKDKIKKNIPLIIAALILIAVLALLLIPGTKYSGMRPKDMDEFKSNGGLIYYDVPENATDEEFYLRYLPGYKVSLYSFSIDDGFDEYMDELNKEHGDNKWVGRLVSECSDPEYPLDDFPTGLPFEKVTETSIENYTLAAYTPKNTGSTTYGIAVYPETHRFVYFYFRSM